MELSARSQRKINSIVEQSSRLFVRNGYHKVTMESIAQYANVSKVTLYKYFSDKLALYEYILIQNADRDYEHMKNIITDFIPYPEKVQTVCSYEVECYYDNNRPNLDESIILSLDSSKYMKKHNTRMKKLRQKLFHQGRMEEFICEDFQDSTLEVYYQAIIQGWIYAHPQILKLPLEEQSQTITLLLQGITKCSQ